MIGNQPLARVDLVGGTDERWVTDPTTTLKLQNVRWDPRGGWERAPGASKILPDSQGVNPFTGQGEVMSMHWFAAHDGGPQYLLWEFATPNNNDLGRLVVFNGSARYWDVLATDRFTSDAPWQRTQYCAIGGSCWILNGVNQPLRFDGRTVFPAGFARPAPSVIATGYNDGFQWGTTAFGLGLGTAYTNTTAGTGEYAYVITEKNEYGTRSPPSAAYGSVKWFIKNQGSAGTVYTKYFVQVRIPPPSSTSVVARELWRTQNLSGLGVQEGVTFYKVMDLQGQGSFPVDDGMPDQYLGEALDTTAYGSWPAGAKYMIQFKNCGWLAGMALEPDRVYRSEPGDFENYPAKNNYRIGTPDSGDITGWCVYRNALVIFKRRGVFFIVGDTVNGFQVYTITETLGCASPNAIQDVPGLGLVFPSEDGMYAIRGTLQPNDTAAAIAPVAPELADYYRWQVNHSAMINACAAVDTRNREYIVSVPVGGQPQNQMALVYHIDRQSWSFRPDLNAACFTTTHDQRRYVLIGSNNASHPGVHVYTPGYATVDGQAITMQVQGQYLPLAGTYEHASPATLNMRFVEYGTNQYNVTVYQDRRPTALTAGGQTRSMLDQEFLGSPQPTWDSSTWSAVETWGHAQPTVGSIDVVASPNGIGSAKEWRFVWSTTARAQFLGFEVRGGSNGVKDIPPINSVLGTGTVATTG